MPISTPDSLKIPADAPWVRMEFGERQTRVVCGTGDRVAKEWVLPIGTQQVGAGPFRAAPPSALELENAIEAVEDVVMPLAKLLPAGAVFLVSGAGVRTALAADELELAQVEDRFNMLAAYSQGRPSASDDPLIQPGAAALLLILRETMHHLGFGKVQLL
jgi:hypothetical protein